MNNSKETSVHEDKTFTNINYAEKRLEWKLLNGNNMIKFIVT